MPRRKNQKQDNGSLHPPGIYDLCGTREGEQCLIAYDKRGECTIDSGVGAYDRLEQWLRNRGVRLPSSRPALFLV